MAENYVYTDMECYISNIKYEVVQCKIKHIIIIP